MKDEFGVEPELVRGSGGVFDVWVDGERIFCKHEEGDFPDTADVLSRIRSRTG
ncbi:MAG: hypothetical protein D6718_08255 [Acidobacteria bacterium]|nr:MAG: hypothetical protein D6718_08255 [Acidobacteriota bacterium]